MRTNAVWACRVLFVGGVGARNASGCMVGASARLAGGVVLPNVGTSTLAVFHMASLSHGPSRLAGPCLEHLELCCS